MLSQPGRGSAHLSLPQLPPQPEMSPTQGGMLSYSRLRVSRLEDKTVSYRSFELHQKRWLNSFLFTVLTQTSKA